MGLRLSKNKNQRQLLISRIENSQSKAKYYISILLNQQQKNYANEIPFKISENIAGLICTQLHQLRINQYDQQSKEQIINGINYFDRCLRVYSQYSTKKEKRDTNICGLLFFGVINIVCIYLLWENFSPYIFQTQNETTGNNFQSFIQNSSKDQNFGKQETNILFSIFYSVGIIVSKIIVAGWAGSYLFYSSILFLNCLDGYLRRRPQVKELYDQIKILQRMEI